MTHKTVRYLFEQAIQLEDSARDLYLALEKMFAHEPGVARFWRHYAAEEEGHAAYLKRIMGNVSAEDLDAVADDFIMQRLMRCKQDYDSISLLDIKNLNDAYELALDVENSETNVIFEFIITHFSKDDLAQAHQFLRTQLTTHVNKLANEFPYQRRFSRQAILPQRDDK